MKHTYKIELNNRYVDENTYLTLADARKALRSSNGGRLHGKFEVPEYDGWAEGWNLGKNEGCATAVIVRSRYTQRQIGIMSER